MTLANMRELTGRLVPSVVSVSEKINRPDHEPSIFLKSPRIAFRIREALDLDPIPADLVIPLQGPARPAASGGRDKADKAEGRQGGGGGMGIGGGLGLGSGPTIRMVKWCRLIPSSRLANRGMLLLACYRSLGMNGLSVASSCESQIVMIH